MGLRKRSLNISGHATSVSLEDEFWDELYHLSVKKQKSLNKLASEVDKARGENNLSSALRIYVLGALKAQIRSQK